MIKKIVLLMLAGVTISVSQYNRPASTDAQFLKIGVSPRGVAMGDAYIAAVEGAEGTFYNSSALAWIKGTDIVFNHTNWFAGINHEFGAVAHTFGNFGTFALSAIALYTDEMLVRTPLQPDGTGETFYSGNYKIGLSYSRYLTDRVTFGLTVNYINMSLYKDFSTDAVSVDIATMYVSDFRGFKFAMQIANFGSNVEYVNESYPLPTNFTFGLSINALEAEEYKLAVNFSACKPNDGEPLTQVGAEWNFKGIFFARGGYKLNHDVATYSFGAGAKYNISGYDVRFDYGFSNYLLLGGSHRFGIGVSF